MASKVTVLGAGAWGTAIASLLARNGHDVLVWAFEPEVASSINDSHTNRFLSGVSLPSSLRATSDLKIACNHSRLIVEVIPVPFIRSTMSRAKPFITQTHRFITTSKGIEESTLLLPAEIVQSIFPESTVAALGGPNFAHDVATGQFSAAMVASSSESLTDFASSIFSSDLFHLVTSTDLIGVQVCGALKNVITVAIGIARAINLSETTIIYLVTQGLLEMADLVCSMGGNALTVYNLPGVGDLMLTALGSESRNLKAGILLGQGESISQLRSAFPVIPEGINTIASAVQLCARHSVSAPLIEAAYEVVCGKLLPSGFLSAVLQKGSL